MKPLHHSIDKQTWIWRVRGNNKRFETSLKKSPATIPRQRPPSMSCRIKNPSTSIQSSREKIAADESKLVIVQIWRNEKMDGGQRVWPPEIPSRLKRSSEVRWPSKNGRRRTQQSTFVPGPVTPAYTYVLAWMSYYLLISEESDARGTAVNATLKWK